MNKLKYILMAVLAGVTLISCNEFVMLDRGEGYLSVILQKDDSVQTKAAEDPAEDRTFSLNIYRGEDLVASAEDHTQLGTLTLVADTYRLTASSGTLQSAAWDSPFYSGETSVKVLPDRQNNAEIVCTIANVVVSVSFDDVFKNNVTDYKVVVDNGESSLTFSPAEGTMDRTAYFSVTGKLNWHLTFTNADNEEYSATGSYSDVKARQHYKINFSVGNPEDVSKGEAGIKLVVDNTINPAQEVIANMFFGLENYPNIITNDEFKTKFPAGDETPKVLTVIAKNGISRLLVRQKENASGVINYSMWYDLVEAGPLEIQEMAAAGIDAESVAYGAAEATIDITGYVSGLVMGKYDVEAVVYDIHGQMKELPITFEVESGVDAEAVSVISGATTAIVNAKWFSNPKPAGLGFEYRALGTDEWTAVDASAITFDEESKRYSAVLTGLTTLNRYEFRPYSEAQKELKSMEFATMNTVEAVAVAPWARFSVVTGKWHDVNGHPSGICFEYREYGTEGWIKADLSTIELDEATKTFVGEIRGLEPNVNYEFRANSDGAAEDQLNIMEFATENAATVYNLSFDDWYQDGKVWYPFAQGGPHTWDSANEGAATFIGSSTTPEESDVVSGKAVRMESKTAVGMFAAGNLYTGDFVEIKISGGAGAVLDWGVPFEARPLALKGHYKYAPKTIDETGSGMGGYKGQMDKMQIQIFITDWTAPFRVKTNEGIFVDFNADYVIAYGKIESDVANDTYQNFTIPLEYRSLDKKPKYIVISAASSYLGDYFTGGKGSVLYVDEFSLEYDPDNLTGPEREKVNYR